MWIEAHAVSQAKRISILASIFISIMEGISISEHGLFYHFASPVLNIFEFPIPQWSMAFAFSTMEDFPARQAWSVLEMRRYLIAHINDLYLLDVPGNSRSNYCLVFDWVECASGVDQSTALFQKLEASF